MRQVSAGAKLFLDEGACLTEIHLPGVTFAQGAHHLTHVLQAAGADIGDHALDRRTDLAVAELLRQETFNDRDLLALLLSQFEAPALFVHLNRIMALLHHRLQHL